MPYQFIGKGIEFSKLMKKSKRAKGPAKVLIVDDEADICFLFDRILRKRNLNAGFASNLAEAMESIESETPSLIFLDNCLPDGQGMDIIPYLKLHYPGTHIIMVTANDGLMDKKRAFQQGADDFLGKPLSLALINNTLDKIKLPNLPV
jgi:two-component system, OmpR family, response regulator